MAGGRCHLIFFRNIPYLYEKNMKSFCFLINANSHDLQKARMSNFACKELVVGGNAYVFLVYFCINTNSYVLPAYCAEDPSDEQSHYLFTKKCLIFYFLNV